MMRAVEILSDPRLLKYGGLAVAGVGLAVLAYGAVARPSSALNRAVAAYAHWLERRFRALFMPVNAKAVIAAQAGAMYAVAVAAVATDTHEALVVSALLGFAPALYLELKHRARVAAIEQQTDGFILALANALKCTPSVGDAFQSLVLVVSDPLKSEIDLATKQMRLGCTLEDVLTEMASRIGSRVFDTALASVLIGQRIGGNLPKILETSASALRELNRLEGVVRSKTSSGRMQLWAIAVAPIVIVLGLGKVEPHWFDPLTSSTIGMMMLGGAVACWITAVIAGRKILRVEV
jgi:tight adherence protein B